MHISNQIKAMAWVGSIAVAGASIGFAYVAAHQVLRQSANDPQIQLAENLALQLNAGNPPARLIPTSNKDDLSNTLEPFAIVADQTGKTMLATAQLNGKDPTLPLGVYQYAQKNGEDIVTWQPQKGVRAALVVVPFQSSQASTSGYVAVGRSLREVEKRSEKLLKLGLAAGVAIVLVLTALVWVLPFFFLRLALGNQMVNEAVRAEKPVALAPLRKPAPTRRSKKR